MTMTPTEAKHLCEKALSSSYARAILTSNHLGETVKRTWPSMKPPRGKHYKLSAKYTVYWDYAGYDNWNVYNCGMMFSWNGKVSACSSGVSQLRSNLEGKLSTPRGILRVVKRLDNYSNWCTRRDAGVKRAQEKLLADQQYYLDKLGVETMMTVQEPSHGSLNMEEIQLLRDGKLIYAIKALRERTRMSLAEAKNTIDVYRAANGLI